MWSSVIQDVSSLKQDPKALVFWPNYYVFSLKCHTFWFGRGQVRVIGTKQFFSRPNEKGTAAAPSQSVNLHNQRK